MNTHPTVTQRTTMWCLSLLFSFVTGAWVGAAGHVREVRVAVDTRLVETRLVRRTCPDKWEWTPGRWRREHKPDGRWWFDECVGSDDSTVDDLWTDDQGKVH